MTRLCEIAVHIIVNLKSEVETLMASLVQRIRLKIKINDLGSVIECEVNYGP